MLRRSNISALSTYCAKPGGEFCAVGQSPQQLEIRIPIQPPTFGIKNSIARNLPKITTGATHGSPTTSVDHHHERKISPIPKVENFCAPQRFVTVLHQRSSRKINITHNRLQRVAHRILAYARRAPYLVLRDSHSAQLKILYFPRINISRFFQSAVQQLGALTICSDPLTTDPSTCFTSTEGSL